MKKGQHVMIYAPSGKGKTSSLRNFDPASTGVINTDKKALPFQGWLNNYKTIMTDETPPKMDISKSNYLELASSGNVLNVLKVWEERDDINLIALDTLTHLMNSEYKKKAFGKGYAGYQKMGVGILDVLEYIRDMKTDVVVFTHEKLWVDELSGKVQSTIKTQGKMVDNFEPASYFTTIMYADIIFEELDEKAPPKYVFRTWAEKGDIVKVPAIFVDGQVKPMFEKYIENDLKVVIDGLNKYENEDS